MGTVELFDHNQIAYKHIVESIENGKNKIAVSHATGTGKSYLVAKLFEDYSNEKKLILVPSTYIHDQIQELFEEYDIKNVDVLLYQSLIKLDDKDIADMDYDVIALDEYHHDTSKVWGAKVRKLIDTHPTSIIFGTSATPVRSDGVNTIDELFDGNCVSDLPLSESIAKKIVPLPKYIGALYTLDNELEKLRKKIDNATNTSEEKQEFYKKINAMRSQIEKSYGMPIILNKHITNKDGKYIIFCKNQKHLREIKDTVIEWFKTAGFKNINAYEVFSDYESKDAEYKAFCDDTSHNMKLLFCINMLNEGLHLENISGVLLLRPTGSIIVFLQQIGRAIEANNTRIPVIIDAVNNFSAVGQGTKLLREIKESIEKESSNDFDDSIYHNIDTFFVLEYVLNIQEIFKNIESKLENDWDLNFRALTQFKYREGDCFVPKHWIEKIDDYDVHLGNWCGNIRQVKKGRQRGLLTYEREEQLNQLGFVWDGQQFDLKWENNFKQLCEYKNNKGNLFQIKDKKLSRWAVKQRNDYKNGNLKQWKIDKLNNINFCWDSLDDGFYYNCSMYEDYMKKHNQFVPIKRKGNKCLSAWCTKIRDDYRKGLLSEEKIEKLFGLGFVFDVNKTYFDAGIKYYIQCKKTMKNIPKGFLTDDGFPLDSWISSQKNKYRRNSLSKYEENELMKIDFCFSENNTQFDNMFIILCDYLKNNDFNMDIPQNLIYKDEKLGQFVSSCRSLKRTGHISKYREEKLESIGFCWNIKDLNWNQNLKFVSEYKRNTGRNISRTDKELKKYYSWLVNNRMWFKQGKLSNERAKMLIESGVL